MLKIRSEQLETLRQGKPEGEAVLIVSVPGSPENLRLSHRIRDEQLQAMAEAQFISQLKQILMSVFPECPPEQDAEFERTLQKVLAKARVYAIVEDAELARYVCLAYLFGADFDTRYSAAQSLLLDRSRPADERLTLLEFWAEKVLEAWGL